ncbi:hypothetical protein GE09DRAFT_1074972 [Coniochaeta sp. 2T2.1]|nr:hypothetical protein GE09DRAFT_1074972 [Coniochaeta sp. 2T2.1]
MAVLSRLGPALGCSRPQLLRISQSSLIHNEPLLPSSLRFRRNIPGQRRNFSIANGLETAVLEATQLITTIHTTTGTPWYITIPLAALAVNLAVRVPVTIYSRRLEQKRAHLRPLFWAWNSRHTENVMRAHKDKPHTYVQAVIRKRSAASERRISKDHGVQTWKIHYLGSITAFPFFITTIQGVRRLCGAGGGIFSLFSNPLPQVGGWVSGKDDAAAESPSTVPAPADQPVDQPRWTSDVPEASGETVTASAPPATQTPLDTDLLGYDPSLSTGGCLWFTDLTVPDPTHVLPLMLSAAMVWVVMPRTLAQTRQLLDPSATNLTWRTRFHRALLVISLVIGPVTMHLPAALHLYWISSTVMATAQRNIVNKLMPLPKNDYEPPKGRDVSFVLPPPPSPPQP